MRPVPSPVCSLFTLCDGDFGSEYKKKKKKKRKEDWWRDEEQRGNCKECPERNADIERVTGALSICSVDSACIPSLSDRRSSISLRLFFSILDDNVPDHLSGFCHWPFIPTATSRTLRNSSAIRLPRPRTSLFLSSPLYLAASAYNSHHWRVLLTNMPTKFLIVDCSLSDGNT